MTGRDDAERPETEQERKRKLDAVFGDVLPESTRDDTDEDADSGTSDDWLRGQVPPHHG